VPLSPNTWLSWIGVGALSFVWLWPARLRNGLAALLANAYHQRDSAQWRTVDINLQACWPALDAVQRKQFYRAYLTAMLQTILLSPRLWWGSAKSIQQHTRFHGRERLEHAHANGQAVILLVSHTTALDVGMIAMAPDLPLHGIYKPFENPVIDWLVHRSRTRFGGNPVARGDGFRAMIKGLKTGGIMCYLSDEDLGAKGSVFAPFFGHQKATLAMLSRIVRRTEAIVIPMATFYDADLDRFDVHFLEPLADFPVDDEIENATRMNRAVEDTVRLNPEQYLWKMRLFRTCPDGGSSRYRQIERGELTPADL